jgi:hypothetical protein
MQLANVIIKDGYVVDPMLVELITPLALAMPSYTFTTRTMDDTQFLQYSFPVTLKNRSVQAPEGNRFMRRLFVFCEDENLGELSIDARYTRGSRNDLVWEIKSWRICNERGDRSTTKTTKVDVAKRAVKKYFLPKGLDEVLKNNEEVMYDYDRALGRLANDISRNTLFKNHSDLQEYVYHQLWGREIPIQLKQRVEAKMTTDKYHKAMSEFDLAASMDVRKDRLIVIRHKGGYLYKEPVVRGSALTEMVTMFQTFEELPSLWQDRLAVLQLMEDEEIVRDVGYRRNDTHFVILTNP